MCTAKDLASCRWNFRSVYTSVLAFWGGKKAVERSGRTNLQSQTYYNHWWGSFPSHCPSPPSQPPCPRLFFFSVYCSFICPASKFEATAPSRGDKVTALAEVTRSHIEFNKQMFTQAPLHQHFVILSLSKTLWEQIEQHKGWDIKKKILTESRITFMLWIRGWGQGGWHGKKCAEQNFMGFFFLFGLFKDYYVLDTVNHLYSHIQEVNLQNFTRG